jgi:8-oxo-dGTP diphosphatase
MHQYKYPRPALTVDIVVFALADELQVMLIRRKLKPFSGAWAIPGGFVHVDETLDDAARRELREETGICNVFLEQLYTFGEVKRDPRERVVSVAYYALVNPTEHEVNASSDASHAEWFPVRSVPKLAFDHDTILAMAVHRLQGKVRYQPIGFELLPRKFPLRDLQKLYEVVLGRELDKRNFRKKILTMDLLVALDEAEADVSHRAAKLYTFDAQKYEQMTRDGFHFEI